MADDPKFVRLHNRLARGCQVDLSSGFSIAGLDIVPFPKDTYQAEYVRDALRRGVLEAASDAEVGAFRDRELDYAARTGVPQDAPRHQEGRVQELAAVDREQIEGSRGLGADSAAAYAADQARRDALIEAADGKTSKGAKDVVPDGATPDEAALAAAAAAAEAAKAAEEEAAKKAAQQGKGK